MRENTINLDRARIDQSSAIPIHWQISEAIKEAIKLGNHKPGDKLPSERKLALFWGVSRVSIRKALETLLEEGILYTEWGKGIFIKDSSFSLARDRKVGFTIWHNEELSYHPATLGMLKGITEGFQGKNFAVEVITVTPKTVNEKSLTDIIRRKQLDGLIATVQDIPLEVLDKLSEEIYVVANRGAFKHSIVIDFREAACKLTNFLLDKGHRRIALINGPEADEISVDVYSGYSEALQEHGLKIEKRLIRYGEYELKEGAGLTEDILVCENGERPTAIILGDDFMSLGALQTLRKMNLKCPEDISLASFNDFYFSAYTNPALTTINIPFFDFGKKLSSRLLKLMEGKPEDEKTAVKGALVVRDSVRSLNET